MKPGPYINIIRLPNAIMSSIAVFLGFWIAESPLSLPNLFMLMISAVFSTAYGNITNDIRDIETDRISHPTRPLPAGLMNPVSAQIFAILLAASALVCSFFVSGIHGIATVIPLILLTVYTFYLKGTPLTGNLLVALLVAYSIIYGAIGAPQFSNLLIPAILAFLLNFSREIVKDLQDHEGDRIAGYKTSASLPEKFLKTLIYCCSLFYLFFLFLPVYYHFFETVYLLICIIVILPIHIYRTVFLIRPKNWHTNYTDITKLYKIEMLCGLIAIASDKIIF
ncbi:MAG: UbiA family prenyltransferase [Fibrobacter sp.]|nr:UbiA family prenyltransferase [Fibrobacter sp.]